MEEQVITDRSKFIEVIKECMTKIGEAKKTIDTVTYKTPDGFLYDGFEEFAQKRIYESSDELCTIVCRLGDIIGHYYKVEIETQILD